MAIEIKVNEEYRITSDERNVTVSRRYLVDPTKAPNWAKREAEGASAAIRESWREVSYHSTVPRAIQSIGEQLVRDSEATSFAELLAEVKRFNAQVESLFNVGEAVE